MCIYLKHCYGHFSAASLKITITCRGQAAGSNHKTRAVTNREGWGERTHEISGCKQIAQGSAECGKCVSGDWKVYKKKRKGINENEKL